MLIRNNWAIPQPSQNKINLGNAVCYDQDLIKSLTVESTAIFSFPDEYRVYCLLAQHLSVPISNLAIGLGLGELIPRILSLYASKKIKIVSPTWQLMELTCQANSINYSNVCYKNFLELDLDQLYVNDSDILYIANPNGVNGQVLTREQILKLCDYYQLVIVDEAYGDFSNQSVMDFAINLPNLLVAKTFTKTLAIPGLRVGFCVANTALIQKIQEIRPGYIMNSMVGVVLDNLLPQMPQHISRMLITKDYIERNYNVISSQSNSILFKELPKLSCATKEVYPGIHRMALTDLATFMELKNEC